MLNSNHRADLQGDHDKFGHFRGLAVCGDGLPGAVGAAAVGSAALPRVNRRRRTRPGPDAHEGSLEAFEGDVRAAAGDDVEHLAKHLLFELRHIQTAKS